MSVLYGPDGMVVSSPELRAAKVGGRRTRRTAHVTTGVIRDFEEAEDLRGVRQRYATFRRMAERDPHISEALRANTLPLLAHAKWTVKPGDEKDPRSVAAAKLVETNILGQVNDLFRWPHRQRTPWSQWLREILTKLQYGVSVFHKHRAVRGDQLVYEQMVWLDPQTFREYDPFEYDEDGNVVALHREYEREDRQHVTQEIPADELVVFGWDVVGSLLNAQPLIRPMYGAYKRKDFIQRCLMLAVQKGAVGHPLATWDPAEGSDDEQEFGDRAQDWLDSTLGPGIEHSALAANNPTFKAEYLQQDPTQITKFGDLVRNDNLEIAHGGGRKSQQLGETQSGSRALGDTQSAFEFILTEAVGQCVAEQLLWGVGNIKGPVQELVELNFGDVAMPTIEVEAVDPNEATRNLPLLAQMKQSGLLDVSWLRDQILTRLGFDPPTPEQLAEDDRRRAAARPFLPPRQEPAAPRERVEPEPEVEQDEREPGGLAARLAASLRKLLGRPAMSRDEAVSAGFSRAPTEFEARSVALRSLRQTLDTAEARVAGVLRSAHRRMLDDVVSLVRNGADLSRAKAPSRGASLKALGSPFGSIVDMGREHAQQELGQQEELPADERDTVAASLLCQTNGETSVDALKPGAAPVPPALREADSPIDTLLDNVNRRGEVSSTIALDEIWSRLVDEARAEHDRLSSIGVEGTELLELLDGFLGGLSLGPVDELARELVTVAYNQGRDVEAKLAAIDGRARYAVRSELLDENTCAPCRALDQLIVEIGSPAYERNQPPTGCLGGRRCRGFMVVAHRRLTEAA